MKENLDIREALLKYSISYSELLEFLDNFSHITRISEELAKPLTEERKEKYFEAIEKVKEKKRKILES